MILCLKCDKKNRKGNEVCSGCGEKLDSENTVWRVKQRTLARDLFFTENRGLNVSLIWFGVLILSAAAAWLLYAFFVDGFEAIKGIFSQVAVAEPKALDAGVKLILAAVICFVDMTVIKFMICYGKVARCEKRAMKERLEYTLSLRVDDGKDN